MDKFFNKAKYIVYWENYAIGELYKNRNNVYIFYYYDMDKLEDVIKRGFSFLPEFLNFRTRLNPYMSKDLFLTFLPHFIFDKHDKNDIQLRLEKKDI